MQLIFLCSSNTCRSPLALCAWELALGEISVRGGQTPNLAHIEAKSAGLCATEGARAAKHAQTIANSWGQDLSQHYAEQFRPEHAKSDLIIAMTRNQKEVIRAHFEVPPERLRLLGDYAPRHAQLIRVAQLARDWEETSLEMSHHQSADEADILDPFCCSWEAYEACSMRIRRCVFELARVMAGFTSL